MLKLINFKLTEVIWARGEHPSHCQIKRVSIQGRLLLSFYLGVLNFWSFDICLTLGHPSFYSRIVFCVSQHRWPHATAQKRFLSYFLATTENRVIGTERRALASCSKFRNRSYRQHKIQPGVKPSFLRGNSALLGANYDVLHFSLGANLPGRSSAAPRATSTIHSTPQILGESPPHGADPLPPSSTCNYGR
jgi:hypothetical protein